MNDLVVTLSDFPTETISSSLCGYGGSYSFYLQPSRDTPTPSFIVGSATLRQDWVNNSDI